MLDGLGDELYYGYNSNQKHKKKIKKKLRRNIKEK